jgi:hypothetical protein
MIENNFFPATKPMGYLLNAFRKKRLIAIPCKLDSARNEPPGNYFRNKYQKSSPCESIKK